MRNNIVNLFYDYIDEACMIMYDELRLDYIQALIRVSCDITQVIDESKLSDEAIERLNQIYQKINETEIYAEEVRVAFELLIAKGFKHIDRSIGLMTPDAIGYLLAYIIRYLTTEDETIIDTALGTGNLIHTVANNTYPNMHLIGIENDRLLVDVSAASTNLQNNDLKIYYQDALTPIADVAKIVIGDLDDYQYEGPINTPLQMQGVKYFPYLVIDERIANIENDGYFIYVVNCDFFNQDKVEIFKQSINRTSTLVGLILLPNEMFIGETKKCILIGKKSVLDKYHMAVLNITSFKEDVIKDVYMRLTKMIEQII